MEGMPPDNGYLPPLSSVQIKTAKTQKHLYCLVFTKIRVFPMEDTDFLLPYSLVNA